MAAKKKVKKRAYTTTSDVRRCVTGRRIGFCHHCGTRSLLGNMVKVDGNMFCERCISAIFDYEYYH